jgi:hypothetical protein
MEGSSELAVTQDENMDKTEQEDFEEDTSHEDIFPGFKTFEEFREVGKYYIIF